MNLLSLPRKHIYTGSLILVNAAHRHHAPERFDLAALPAGGDPSAYKTTSVPAGGPLADPGGSPGISTAVHTQLLDRRAAALLSELMKKLGGWKEIVPVSGWRSHREQQQIWDDTMAESGPEFTRTFVAVPGHSEHETGLAIDLGIRKDRIDFICPDFPYDGICGRFRSLAASYGFVERYPAGRESVTGIGHEPWHFRYVGVPHALIMEEQGFTLEEYTVFLRDYPHEERPYRFAHRGMEFSVSYQPAAARGNTAVAMEEERPYSVSGNNVDGYIITEWRNTHADTQDIRRT